MTLSRRAASGIQNSVRYAIRTVFLMSVGRLYRAFLSSLDSPQHVQARVRKKIARLAIQSEYGKKYQLKCEEDFRKKLPLVTYEDLEPEIAKMLRGNSHVLFPGKPQSFEKTSGSSGAAKFIPYSRDLLRSFARLFLLWSYDLLQGLPELGHGKLYFSISPRFSKLEKTAGGKPIGLETDADYLGRWLKPFLSCFLILPTKKGPLAWPSIWTDTESFQRATALTLLSEREELEAISIWNPSYLEVILDWILTHRFEIAQDASLPLSEPCRMELRADSLDFERLWPKLRLISCWKDASAQAPATRLAKLFPSVTLQGKGLLATEAPLTLPLLGVEGGVPLLQDVYFEFIPSTRSSAEDFCPKSELPLELHQLEIGQTYSVIISQSSGLYRYRMQDEVRVVSKLGRTPTLIFVGRGHTVSDLVGEKLHEKFLRSEVEPMIQQNLGPAAFATLIPSPAPQPGYLLLTSTPPSPRTLNVSSLEDRVEGTLCSAHHYSLARQLGQLRRLRAYAHPQAARLYLELQQRQGLRLGDIKPALLSPKPADSVLLRALEAAPRPASGQASEAL